MEQLFEYFKRKLSETPIDLIRYKYGEIEWGGHALGLVGPRGVGKSTMLLQYIKMRLDVKDTRHKLRILLPPRATSAKTPLCRS